MTSPGPQVVPDRGEPPPYQVDRSAATNCLSLLSGSLHPPPRAPGGPEPAAMPLAAPRAPDGACGRASRLLPRRPVPGLRSPQGAVSAAALASVHACLALPGSGSGPGRDGRVPWSCCACLPEELPDFSMAAAPPHGPACGPWGSPSSRLADAWGFPFPT